MFILDDKKFSSPASASQSNCFQGKANEKKKLAASQGWKEQQEGKQSKDEAPAASKLHITLPKI